jgi:hypothetical protein
MSDSFLKIDAADADHWNGLGSLKGAGSDVDQTQRLHAMAAVDRGIVNVRRKWQIVYKRV